LDNCNNIHYIFLGSLRNGWKDEHPEGKRTWDNDGKYPSDTVNFFANERLKSLVIRFKETTEAKNDETTKKI
jgi:hypothetical protein